MVFCYLFSFHPETVFFRPGGVNLHGYLCGVLMYASAQPLDFDSALGLTLRAACAVNFCSAKVSCQDKKILVSELKTTSFLSGVSGWKLFK
jgi:hypothetical protein